MDWLRLKKRRGTPLAEGVEPSEVQEVLEAAFMKEDEATLAAWSDPEDPSLSVSVRRTADKFVRGYRLAKWVEEQNAAEGVAVPSASLLEHWNSSAEDAAQGALVAVPVPNNSSGRCWATRWRRQFGGRPMQLRVEEPLPLDVRRSKALGGANSVGLKTIAEPCKFQLASWVPFWGRFFGTFLCMI